MVFRDKLDTMRDMETIVDIVFLIDMFFNFIKAYYTPYKKLIVDIKYIAIHYAKYDHKFKHAGHSLFWIL
jgi:hypothetical protein